MSDRCPHYDSPAPCRACGSEEDIVFTLYLGPGNWWVLCHGCRMLAVEWVRDMLVTDGACELAIGMRWFRLPLAEDCNECEMEEAAERRALDAKAEALSLEDAYREAERLGFKVR